MAYSQLGVIEATDYNNFVTSLNTLWGSGNGSTGYGQTGSLTTVVTATEVVTASQWATLISRAKTILNHQGDSTMSAIGSPTISSRINYISELATGVSNASTNKLAAGSNATDVSMSPMPSVINWALPAPTTLQMTYTVTFASADEARYFFNCGGKVYLQMSATDASGTTKGSDWASLIQNKIGNYFINSASSSRSGTGGSVITSNSRGYWDLTTSDTTLLSIASTTATYTSNIITIKARTNGTQGSNGDNGTVITITVDFSDDGFNSTDGYDDSIDLSISNQVVIRPVETTYLTTSIANPTVVRSSYAIDASGVPTVGIGPRSFEYYAAGTYTWTVPTGVTSMRTMITGGGGGGGSSEQGGGSCSGDGGGGGGGGELAIGNISVTPGHVIQFTCGAAGAGAGVNAGGGRGGTSYIIDLDGSSDFPYAARFNGTNDYLKINDGTVFNFGSSDFTMEAWVYLDAMPTVDTWPSSYSSTMVIASVGTPLTGDGFSFIIGANYLMVQNNDTRYISSTLHRMEVAYWYHLACVRSGNTIYFYVNGQNAGSVAFSVSLGTGSGTYIGSETGNGAFLAGRISNFRAVSGTAVYTTTFNPSRGQLTAISGTRLLTCQSASFVDNSGNGFTIVTYNSPYMWTEGTRTTLAVAQGGLGGGGGGNGHAGNRGYGNWGGARGFINPAFWTTSYRYDGGLGGNSNGPNCGGGCCAGSNGQSVVWNAGSLLYNRGNSGTGVYGDGGLAGWASGGGGGGGGSLGTGGRGGNGNGAATDSRSQGMPGAYGGGGGGSCDEVIGGNTRGAGSVGYVYVEYD